MEPASGGSPAGLRVVTGTLHRVQHGRRKRFVSTTPPGPVRRPARIAMMLALAHKIQQAIDEGRVTDRAEVARRLGVTRARVTHLLDLTLLAPDLQERLLGLEAVDGAELVSERRLRTVVRAESWDEQRRRFAAVASAAPKNLTLE